MHRKTRISQEKLLVEHMIRLYCKKKHKGEPLCSECTLLEAYSNKRLDKYPYGENKTA